MLGVSTIGNAILIAYDDNPILATDPWVGDENPAYFGNWGLSHRIPPDCKADILNAYIWFSHGPIPTISTPVASSSYTASPPVCVSKASKLLFSGSSMGRTLPEHTCLLHHDSDPRQYLIIGINKRIFVNLNDAGSRDCSLLVV